ncbi:cupredoxin domain-containing protein [Candidatus Uhrbacteria bacterium]|nr:cupredoxin domain-containing protein [Candidatus Uhrbacteria bacterium]
MKKLFVLVMILGVAFGAHLLSGRPQANANVAINPGDLIRGETFSAVYYYGSDGFRYVFPNTKTYDTWYANFDSVKFVTDSQLGQLQIGGNVTYRPGVKMIKIDTDPKTYAVAANGVLRHVTGEAVASGLYGSNWNTQIHDVPDAFFTNYSIGDAINSASEFDKAAITSAASTINSDKGLRLPAEISVSDSVYNPTTVNIVPGQTVRFTNNGTTSHTVTSDDLTWGSGTMTAGRSFVRQFEEAGTYTFFDSYNSQLTGAIYVQ